MFLTIFNADKYAGEKKDEMIRLFPNLMKWVFDMKKKSGYKSVSKFRTQNRSRYIC